MQSCRWAGGAASSVAHSSGTCGLFPASSCLIASTPASHLSLLQRKLKAVETQLAARHQEQLAQQAAAAAELAQVRAQRFAWCGGTAIPQSCLMLH